MKKKILSFLLLLLALPLAAPAQLPFVNLTPRPKTMAQVQGTLVLPSEFTVGYSDMDEAMTAEIDRFVKDFNAATGYNAKAVKNAQDALFSVTRLAATSKLKEGGYTLSVKDGKVTVKANEALGLFYAFMSIKKILPANVIAGIRPAGAVTYELPCVTVSDEPRYEYRGFMLDVARHFFTVEEVKRMLDIMSYYKMNRFHWHLSDDQGWRVEIKKYPKLTTVGATAPNCRMTDMYSCTQYWINRPYGPYFYTQDEIRDVVAYAKERHIEIIPEIDMPGHFVAALSAYPEFSCTPEAARSLWVDGGISSDVLNVANPKAVQFCKDIMNELMELFPYEVIHMGGDECPTSAWENNAECQARYRELGLTNYRQLQSLFIKEIYDFVHANGRKLAVWNEAITAGNADTEMVKSTDALVYCWTGPEAAATKAKELGLKNIYTPWGPYYINRRQGNSAQDPPGAGDGSDHVQRTYNTVPPEATDYGVQGTFWTEHVSDREYMEWLALPRLLAVAEAGWTPQSRKNFADFQKRMSADTVLFKLRDYRYCKYYMLDAEGNPDMVMPHVSTAKKSYYYRLVTGCTDNNRKDRCIELLSASSPLVAQYSDKNAAANRLWTNVQAEEGADNYSAQWWRLEENPAAPGKFALVCMAKPDGSVKPEPTATNNTGRWDYDDEVKHYDFVLGTGAYGTSGKNRYYSVTCENAGEMYMNTAAAGQGFSVNLWNNPADGGSGQWVFVPMEDYDGGGSEPITFIPLETEKIYTVTNNVDGYDGTRLADLNKGTALGHSTDAFAANAWRVTAAADNADGTQTVKLQNVATGRYISSVAAYVSRQGYPVNLGTTAGEVVVKHDAERGEFRLLMGDRSFFPLPAGSVNAGATIQNAAYDAPRLQGAAWTIKEVKVVSLVCADDHGNALGTYSLSVDPEGVAAVKAEDCPAFKNMSVEKLEFDGTSTYTVTYKRSAYSLVVRSTDSRGAIIAEDETTVPVGGNTVFAVPEHKYFTLAECELADGTVVTPENDMLVNATFTTDALVGVSRLGDAVTETDGLKDGNSYVFFDASDADNNARQGYRCIVESTKGINRYAAPEDMKPNAVWTLEAQSGNNKFRVKNEYYGLYVPQLARSANPTASKTGHTFTFALNPDGESWNIKGTNGMYWDGLANGDLVGWDGGTGHPIRIFTYYAKPFFTVSTTFVDEDGKEVASATTELLPAGDTYTIAAPAVEGYVLKAIEGDEGFEGTVEGHLTLKVVYGKIQDGIGEVETSSAAGCRSGIYDLQGRRLNRVTRPGIYVVNGRKVLVK